MQHLYDMLILGGGPAGYTAALYASRAGLDTVLIEKMAAGGQMALTGDIDNYPGFEDGIDGFTLGMKMQKGAERFGAKTEYAEVTAVDFSGKIKTVKTTDKDFFARTVLVSTGANPRTLGLEGEAELTGRGIHYCAHCDGRFYKDKTVMVVGGGNSAVQDALYLSRLARKVYLVHRRDTLRASSIYQESLRKTANIEFLQDSVISDFVAEGRIVGAVVKNVRTDGLSRIDCDGIFISIGRKPATELFADKLELDDSGYIIADETTRSSVEGVFAAGDVRTKALRQVVTAVSDGAVAAHFAEKYLTEEGGA